jgi:transglutaminase-like putative cysteine protease
MRIVALPVAVSLGAIGAIAADRISVPALVGFAAGALAGGLAVLALPSLSTRRATVLVLGIGGIGALRHAAASGGNRTFWLALWAVGTLVALVLVDRVDAESHAALPGGAPLPARGPETARAAAFIGLAAIVAAVLFVPTVTEKLGRREWPGKLPGLSEILSAPSSLRQSNSLDMTSRPRLSDKVVFTVDSERASFWRGETFDLWDGTTWTRSADDRETFALDRDAADRVQVPPAPGDVGASRGRELRQTFHVETGYSDVLFAAPSARTIETDKSLRARVDGTVVVGESGFGGGGGFGKGAVYTVTSQSIPATADMLRSADNDVMPPAIKQQYAQTPFVLSERVAKLAKDVTANASTTYDKIKALEAWLGANTKYSINAPLSPKGVDVVDDFLFRSRVGWCEQIASSLVVLARSVGIPARLTTGFVPGSRDGLSGRFVVRERDAHAWAEIYFPGIGWQGFDPTASVPLAGSAKAGGSFLDTARRNAVALGVLLAIVVLAIGFGPALVARMRRRRAQRAVWSSRTLRRLERVGRKAGRAREPAETPREYAHALAGRLHAPDLERVGATIDTDAFSADGAAPNERDAADAVLRSLRP